MRARTALLRSVAALWALTIAASAVVMLRSQRSLVDWASPERRLFLAQTGRALHLTPAQLKPYRGCAFNDGFAYCTAASGKIGNRPWSHRPLVPFLARIVKAVSGWGFVGSFTFLAGVGLVLTVVALAALGYGIALRSGVAQHEARLVAGGAILLWLATPFSLRIVVTAPVLVDELATALIVVWLAAILATKPTRGRTIVAPAIAFLATLAREVGVGAVVITCVVALALGIITRRELWTNSAAAAFAFAIDLSRPHGLFAGNSRSVATRDFVTNLQNPRASLAAILMGTGIALFVLLPPCLVRLNRVLPDPRRMQVLATVVVAYLVSATFIGSDLPRYSSAATPMLCVLFATYVVLVADIGRIVLLTLAAAFILAKWKMFTVIHRTPPFYVDYFRGNGSFHLRSALVLAAFAGILLVADFRALRTRAPTPA